MDFMQSYSDEDELLRIFQTSAVEFKSWLCDENWESESEL